MKYGVFIKLLLLVICLCNSMGFAQNTLDLSDRAESYPVEEYLSYIEDKDNSFALAEVLKLDAQNKFIQVTKKGLSLGYTKSAYWFKLTLTAVAENSTQWLIQFAYPLLSKVTLYSPETNNAFTETTSGYLIPYHEREMPSKYVFFPLKNLNATPKTVYFKISSQNSFIVNAEIKSLKSLLHNESKEKTYFYLMLGILVGMFIFNSFIGVSTNSIAYKFYVLYLLNLIVFQIAAGGLLPELFSITNISVVQKTMSISMGFIILCSGVFATLFLRLSITAPKMHKIIVALIIMSVLWILAGFILPFSKEIPIGAVLMMITASVLIASAVIRTIQRYRPAYFYLFSWIFILMGGSLFALRTVGIIGDSFLSKYSIQIGGVCEALLIAFALADRMNMDRNEREKAQKILQEEHLEVERLQKIELQNQLIEKDLAATHAVQEALLPRTDVIPSFNFASYYKPAEQTGGDWFSYIWEKEHNRIYIFIGDVTGHGISSALVTGVACGAIRSSISTLHRDKQNIPSLDECLTAMAHATNTAIIETGTRSGRFMTMLLIGIDTLTGEAAIANAGHNMPLLISAKDGKVAQINQVGNRLGFTLTPNFTCKKFKMETSDVLFLYTDGLIENHSETGDIISLKALKNHLNHNDNIEIIKDDILQLCTSTWKGHPFNDDVSFLLVKWDG